MPRRRPLAIALTISSVITFAQAPPPSFELPAPTGQVGRVERAGASDLIYRRAASKYYRVDMNGTLHLDFTDMNYWGGLLAKRAFGPMGAARAAELTRLVVREFFGQEILGRPSAFLAGKQPMADVTVNRVK